MSGLYIWACSGPQSVYTFQILLHTAGIVLMTLLLNATTVQPLLNILGMSEVSVPKRMAMASAVRALNDVVNTSTRLYKTDRSA